MQKSHALKRFSYRVLRFKLLKQHNLVDTCSFAAGCVALTGLPAFMPIYKMSTGFALSSNIRPLGVTVAFEFSDAIS